MGCINITHLESDTKVNVTFYRPIYKHMAIVNALLDMLYKAYPYYSIIKIVNIAKTSVPNVYAVSFEVSEMADNSIPTLDLNPKNPPPVTYKTVGPINVMITIDDSMEAKG